MWPREEGQDLGGGHSLTHEAGEGGACHGRGERRWELDEASGLGKGLAEWSL
jgi:hypothetical protein